VLKTLSILHLRRTARRYAIALFVTTLAAAASSVHAQTTTAWPSKPIRFLVGYPVGSSPDIQARILAEPLSKALGQPVMVENRPGASGNIGADLLAKSTDNHTVGIIGNGPLTSSKYLYSRLSYDPTRDFAPLALVGTSPLMWVVPADAMPGDTSQYIAQARARGDTLSYGSVGTGSGGHLGMELLKAALGIEALHVPYAGGPAIINNMIGGQVDMALLPVSTVIPLVQSGKLKAVAVTSAQRSVLAPDVPSMREVGARDVDIEVWNAVMAPANMPQAIQARLSAVLQDILSDTNVCTKLLSQGWNSVDPSPGTLATRMASDSQLYGDLIARIGARLD